MLDYPKWLWTRNQKAFLENYYHTLIPSDGEITIDEKTKFWLIRNGQTEIKLSVNKFKEIGVNWDKESIKNQFVILNEYKYLDENQKIKI